VLRILKRRQVILSRIIHIWFRICLMVYSSYLLKLSIYFSLRAQRKVTKERAPRKSPSYVAGRPTAPSRKCRTFRGRPPANTNQKLKSKTLTQGEDARWPDRKAGATRKECWAAFFCLDFFVSFCVKTKRKVTCSKPYGSERTAKRMRRIF
jgi:hypothetical protein